MFVLFGLSWVFIAVPRLSLVKVRLVEKLDCEGYALVVVCGLLYGGFFCCGTQTPGAWASVVAACRLSN